MKTAVVIPSYWGRKSGETPRAGDQTYDHPTPLDAEGTLLRCLQSLSILRDRDFTVVVLGCPTADEIAEAVEQKLRGVLKRAGGDIEMLLLGPSHLARMRELLAGRGREAEADLLNFDGYSPVRNMCLFAGHLLDAESTVFIDDDEVFEDPAFIAKTREFIGQVVDGERVLAVAGYYLQPNGRYQLEPRPAPWMHAWNNVQMMNAAFEQFIGREPRLKPTPFVFGGNMVVHRDLGCKVPFDPNVPRGEDIDYLMNARMFGHNFFLDNTLSIKHLPPPNTNPRWLQIRKDMRRFAFERAKIDCQRKVTGMTRIAAEDFDPYPGCFLKADLETRAIGANQTLALEYLAAGKTDDAQEALENITLTAFGLVPEENPFHALLELQARWQSMMAFTGEPSVRRAFRALLR